MLYHGTIEYVANTWICVYVLRKVGIGAIPELHLRKVAILELYRTILELYKGNSVLIYSVRKVGIDLDKVGIPTLRKK